MLHPLAKNLRQVRRDRTIEEVWQKLERRQNRARIRVLWAALPIACAILAVILWIRREPGTLQLADGSPFSANVSSSEMALSDGSVLRTEAGAKFQLEENTSHSIGIRLERGRMNFDIKPGGPRRWKIDAGIASVVVLGTRFFVDRGDHSVRVTVLRGHVQVTKVSDSRQPSELYAGDSIEVSDGQAIPAASALPATSAAPETSTSELPLAPSDSAKAPTQVPAKHTAEAPAHNRTEGDSEPQWKALAQQKAYKNAYEALGTTGVANETKRVTSTSDLLALADVARLSGHPRDAIAPLTKVVEQDSANAGSSAFTLGKILLDDLQEPEKAGRWFEKSIELQVPTALLEDAMARSVQAWVRAGNPARAKAARDLYVTNYPNGRHIRAIDQWLQSAH